jgi:hypothetical protein
VLRVAPSDPAGDLSYRPSPGETFEARLRNRELEGVYSIRVGDNGELTATGRIRNGTEVSERIQPSDIAPRYVNVDSPDFNQRFQVDAFFQREAETRARSIATEPAGLPVRDPNLGSMPETVRPQVLRGVDGLDAQADFIRRHAADVTPGTEPRLTVFNIGFSNQGEAQRVVDAMVDFRRQHPDARIEVVAERARFESASRAPGYDQFLQTLRDNGVQLNFFENGDTSRQVIHAKGVIVNDQVQFTTGAVIDGSKNKVDIATELPPDAARSFIRFFDQGINGNADPATRQQLLADMSRQGVLVDDPVTRTPYISRTQDALINGAQDKLFISISDLTNPDTTRAIIDRVRNGVDVEIQYREMDPRSRILLDQTMQQYPDRLRVENISNWDPRPHYNVIVADDRQGYVGTSYLWPNQQQQTHHTRSFENGVLLQGDSVRVLVDQLEELRRSQQPNLRSDAQVNERTEALRPSSPEIAARPALEDPLRHQGTQPSPNLRAEDALWRSQSQDVSEAPRSNDPSNGRGSSVPAVAQTQTDAVPPGPPQPGDASFTAYQQSRSAVERLNTGFNIAYGEPSEKLTVAAATVALQQNLRVDEVALNPPSATLAGGTTAFVIEKSDNGVNDRYGTVSMQQAMQTPLDQGYQRLNETGVQALAQTDRQTQQQALENEQRESMRRMA